MSAPLHLPIAVLLTALVLRAESRSAQYLEAVLGAENVEIVIDALRGRGFEVPVWGREVSETMGTAAGRAMYRFSARDEALFDRLTQWTGTGTPEAINDQG